MTGATDLLLPHGWTLATFDDVLAAPLANGRSVPDAQNPSKAFPVLRLTSLKNGRIDLTERKLGDWSAPDADPFLVQPDDFLVSRGNGSKSLVGRGGLVTSNPDPIAYPDTLIRVRVDQSMLSSKFLAVIWNSSILRRQIETAARTTAGIYKINQQDMRSFVFPVPPLNEQHRIVAAIETQFTRLDAAVAALERSRANLKRYRVAILKAACEGRLVPTEAELARAEGRDVESGEELLDRICEERRLILGNGRQSRYEEPANLESGHMAALPMGWSSARAEQICDFITKGTTPAAHKLHDGAGDIPFIKVYNLTTNGRLDFSVKPSFISVDTHEQELRRSRIRPGDVLMNIVGPPLGKVSVVPDTYSEWNMNQAVAVFRPMPSFDRRFLCICLLNEETVSWAIRRAKATAGQFNLTLEICRDLPLPVPPLAEQQRIVAEVERRLSVVDDMEKTIVANLKRAEHMRQAILARAFAGKLVPQDPTDEPASALLERIRAESSIGDSIPERGRRGRAKQVVQRELW